MTSSLQAALRRLAARLGVALPDALQGPHGEFDLTEPRLIGNEEPALAALLDSVSATPELDRQVDRAIGGVVRGLQLATGLAPEVTLFANEAAAVSAMLGAHEALLVGDVLPYAVARRCELRGDELPSFAGDELLVLEPDLPLAQLQRLVDAAHAAGVRVLFDERRTAFRGAAATVARQLQRGPDLVLLGAALAAGLPFAAVIGSAGASAATPIAAVVAAAVLEHLRAGHLQAEWARSAAELVAAVDAAARAHELQLRWSGLPSMPRLHFADQDSAQGELIDHHFGLELAAAGCRAAGPLLLPPSPSAATLAKITAAFVHAVARVRTLLIEYNSYLSGGIPFVFPSAHELLRARGVMRYRYPRLAEVDVDARGEAIRIAFAAGDLGAVTSSGFYVPTRLCGDVDVQVRYVAERFASGPDATCLGLFLQNEASTARYYAQLMSTCDAPTSRSVALGHEGSVYGRTAVLGHTGWLRLCRRDGRMFAFHREVNEATWRELGSVPATADDLVVGAKIWSKQGTSGLVAELFELRVDAQLAAVQPELLGPRPDPRADAKNR